MAKQSNQYKYDTAQGTASGAFNIYQAKNGSIQLAMGSSSTTLTEQQLFNLNINCHDLKDFDHDTWMNFYKRNGAPAPRIIHPSFDGADIAEIVERKKNGYDCTEEESSQIKRFIIDHSDTIITDTQARDNDDYLSSLFPCEYSEAWKMIEDK